MGATDMRHEDLTSMILLEDAARMEINGSRVAVIVTNASHEEILRGIGTVCITEEGLTINFPDAVFVLLPADWSEYNCGSVRRDDQQSEYHITRIDAILVKLLWRH
jgi:hypothetical protein